jgi:hypothetical protein
MVEIWLFHPNFFLKVYTFCSKECFWECFLAFKRLKETLAKTVEKAPKKPPPNVLPPCPVQGTWLKNIKFYPGFGFPMLVELKLLIYIFIF